MTQWRVDTALIENWMDQQSTADIALLQGALHQLREHGPALRRPLVGEVRHSRFKNMKELRPASTGRSEIRILFAFDPERSAILLLAGDKANESGVRGALKWNQWYRSAIPQADKLYEEHLNSLKRRKA